MTFGSNFSPRPAAVVAMPDAPHRPIRKTFYPRPISKSERKIIEDSAKRAEVSVDCIVGCERTWVVSKARAFAAWRLREDLGLTEERIGLLLGGRHPATIAYLIDRYHHDKKKAEVSTGFEPDESGIWAI